MTAGYKPTDDDGLSEAWGEADRAALTPSQEPAVPSDVLREMQEFGRAGMAEFMGAHHMALVLSQKINEWADKLAAAPTQPAPEVERQQLRNAQAAAVMPLIGPLLDAWEGTDRAVMSEEPELSKQLRAINNAMESAEAAAPTPPAQSELKTADDDFLLGVCVALQTVTSMDCGVTWRQIVESVGVDEILYYAAWIEREEWELAGFARYARRELRRGQPPKGRPPLRFAQPTPTAQPAMPEDVAEPVAFIEHSRNAETGIEETDLVWSRDEDLDGGLFWYTPLYAARKAEAE